MTHIATSLVTAGRTHEGFGSVNPPIYRASTILFDSFDGFCEGYYGRTTPAYARQGNPTVFALRDALGALIDAEHTVLTSSGLSAVTIPLLALLRQGDHVLVADAVYGPTRAMCDHVLHKMGIETTYYNPMITPDDLEALIRPNTRLVFLEAPGSMTIEMQDIAGVCAVAHKHGCITMLDYTWATPLYIKPFALGVDVAIQAVTKYVAGHSDVVMGAVSARTQHFHAISKMAAMLGNYVTGDEAALALRGLRSMKVRIEQQQKNIMEVLAWLKQRPEIAEILYPPHPDDAGHSLWKKHMSGGASLCALVLNPSFTHEATRAWCDALKLFGMGFSWGGYESLIVPFRPKEVRTATAQKWESDPWCIRMHIGLEDPRDVIADLEQAFARATPFLCRK
ncbi:MAG: cystathionine beta-lyase [Alphaproteobacteria bacterium]|nr:MAG: cystathionine beta-lyase [Alphaproteobacteria bacterium]TAF14490.1 MAG: cystathionine beta-lyase [Alphaproteobacteria bacterium]TAF37989.1 MAG: cystathionine beta-lyase [Alphaproteobacteria bacterium]TAF76062.1 MAG: cystathionine beta-lyase [Alphaproteobacteria bacterium]